MARVESQPTPRMLSTEQARANPEVSGLDWNPDHEMVLVQKDGQRFDAPRWAFKTPESLADFLNHEKNQDNEYTLMVYKVGDEGVPTIHPDWQP